MDHYFHYSQSWINSKNLNYLIIIPEDLAGATDGFAAVSAITADLPSQLIFPSVHALLPYNHNLVYRKNPGRFRYNQEIKLLF